ncbi:glutaredoxin [Thecamonas trahens ATCC 50062]|uniref:Glutaredoxin n=1 Tax=Thecamonas trahens ATCC 50062 TaxID=461836 RepID=A0A0L0D6H9_THETB|nr:glutaredoxin [Thecamonas trahens ATCC 50062]KNC47676.1 glutaredoxin [Thecamonas trahens ATCC 50062]|eukprot:XP_013759160.1 glutaredoxin [Thecamonas trahens ATCC 50062]
MSATKPVDESWPLENDVLWLQAEMAALGEEGKERLEQLSRAESAALSNSCELAVDDLLLDALADDSVISSSFEDLHVAALGVALDDLILELRHPEFGLEIKKRTYHLRKYHDCFVGSEAVDWMLERYGGVVASREDAVVFLQRLVDIKVIRHVCDDHPLRDGYFFYRFLVDDASYSLNTARVVSSMETEPLSLITNLRKTLQRIYGNYLLDDGLLNLDALAASPSFAHFQDNVAELQSLQLNTLTTQERTTFFINTYNILVVHAAIVYGHPTNRFQRAWFFSKPHYLIDGHVFSLSVIEHGILRANTKAPGALRAPLRQDDPRLAYACDGVDPRIHFALNCGAISCPPIRVYLPHNVEAALELSAHSFCEHEAWVVSLASERGAAAGATGKDDALLDASDHDAVFAANPMTLPSPASRYGVSLSKLFSWYNSDFATSDRELLLFIARYVNDIRAAVLHNLATTGNYKIKYRNYNWTANIRG